MIIVDTREREWDHVRSWFERNDVAFERHKLDFGDYMIPGADLTIDRKRNLDEIAGNLCTSDKRRFWNEIRNAKKAGLRVVVLIEHSKNYTEPRDVLKWRSNYSKITGQMLFREMFAVQNAYGVEFRFCDKKHTGQRIVELLEAEWEKVKDG